MRQALFQFGEIHVLVESAQNQDYVSAVCECPDRRIDRVRIGRFGIVDVSHSVLFKKNFHTVRIGLKRPDRLFDA